MNSTEFNKKWYHKLQKGHYGNSIENESVNIYLDNYFQELEKIGKQFTYSQIKLKFGFSRIYMENIDDKILFELENNIDKILKVGKIE